MTTRAKTNAACFLAVAPLLFVICCVTNATPESAKQADRIVIEKSKRTMTLMGGGTVLKTYKVALGGQPVGAKQRIGEHKTPEGLYIVDQKKAASQFHRALHTSYPNAHDRENARKLGVSHGGDVEIHGLGAKYAGLAQHIGKATGRLYRGYQRGDRRDLAAGCL